MRAQSRAIETALWEGIGYCIEWRSAKFISLNLNVCRIVF